MFARGRSKDRSSRKVTPPEPSYMDSGQFANYLTELREKRVARPGGARTPATGASTRQSIDSTARGSMVSPVTTVPGTPSMHHGSLPRADSALGNRTTAATTTTAHTTASRPKLSTSRSRRSMPPPSSPTLRKKAERQEVEDPTIVQPSATYIERGQRWMERSEASSLRGALEDMDFAELQKAKAAGMCLTLPGTPATADAASTILTPIDPKFSTKGKTDEQIAEDMRIAEEAKKEAIELVFAHQHPDELKRRKEEEERRRMTGYAYEQQLRPQRPGYREHLRKGSYQHARAQSVGRDYKGEDAVHIDLSTDRPGLQGRGSTGGQESVRSSSRTSLRERVSSVGSRSSSKQENRASLDETRGRDAARKTEKSYGKLTSTFATTKGRNWSSSRRHGRRNISGEINTVFSPDQIWEEPESGDSRPQTATKEPKEGAISPLKAKTKNPLSRVQFEVADKDVPPRSQSAPAEKSVDPLSPLTSHLPQSLPHRTEIYKNPPTQSRNPLYTDNRSRSVSPAKPMPEVPMKDGKEIRSEELVKATSKSLSERSEKLPTPTAVSDRVGRPIVSFDKSWKPPGEAREDGRDAKKQADVPLVTCQGGKSGELGTAGPKKDGIVDLERGRFRVISGSRFREHFGEDAGPDSSRERGTSRERRGEREEGKEKKREGYVQVTGCPPDQVYELASKSSHCGELVDGQVVGKWVVETKGERSTVKIENDETEEARKARQDGVPYVPGDVIGAISQTPSRETSQKSNASKSEPKVTPRFGMDASPLEPPVWTDLTKLAKQNSGSSSPRTSLEKREAASAAFVAASRSRTSTIEGTRPRTSTLDSSTSTIEGTRPRTSTLDSSSNILKAKSIFETGDTKIPTDSSSLDSRRNSYVPPPNIDEHTLKVKSRYPFARPRAKSTVSSPVDIAVEKPTLVRGPSFRRNSTIEPPVSRPIRASIEDDRPRIVRSPFARPSLGPSSESSPPKLTLDKNGTTTSRSPFARPAVARSSALSNEISSGGSIRRSPFDRPARSSLPGPHSSGHNVRSSLGAESGSESSRPSSPEKAIVGTVQSKLPWMRGGNVAQTASSHKSTVSAPAVSVRDKDDGKVNKEVESEAAREIEDAKVEEIAPILQESSKASEQPSRSSVNENAAPSPLPSPISEPAAEKVEAPSEQASSTSQRTTRRPLVSSARPLPARSMGPRHYVPAPSPLPQAQRMPEDHSTPAVSKIPVGEKAAPTIEVTPQIPAAPHSAISVPSPAAPVLTPPTESLSEARPPSVSAISVPSVKGASVLAPPTESLSEVRPPAPASAASESAILPTIYGPARTESPLPPILSVGAPSAPAIAIRAPSGNFDAPSIAISAPPAMNVSATPPQPPRPMYVEQICVPGVRGQQPTRPASIRPLPRPGSSGGRPLPQPGGRPLPPPGNSSRGVPPSRNAIQGNGPLARPGGPVDSHSHWSPDPQMPGSRATATCHACSTPIEGKVIALAGIKERWHPACMACHVCAITLSDFDISPEPDFARKARLARIEAREAGMYVAEGEATDGDGVSGRKLRFYCHLDWHEAFAPRCKHCKTPIIGEHVVALGGQHWHFGHFFCAECGDPFEEGQAHVEEGGYAWCVSCMEKRTERRAPRCGLCRKNVVGEVVSALGKEFHAECFKCGDCQRPFVDGEIYLREDVGVSCRGCMERWSKKDVRPSSRGVDRPSSRGYDERPTSSGGDYRPTSRGADYRPSSRGYDQRPMSRGGY